MILSGLDRAPRLVWNASSSMPTGLYAIERVPPVRGDVVVARLPDGIARLMERRGYLPKSALLLKSVAAVSGMHICAIGYYVVIDRRSFVRAARRDLSGRPLFRWAGCRYLRSGELFLLGSHPTSFDSRYFGPVTVTNVIGRAWPLWTWPTRSAPPANR